MSTVKIDDVKKAEVVRRIVARSIAEKAWRSTCEDECRAYASGKAEREAVSAYVRAEYDVAGAGFAGRWQA